MLYCFSRHEEEESSFLKEENSLSQTIDSRKEVNVLETNMNNTTSTNQDSEISCTATEPNPVSLLECVKKEIQKIIAQKDNTNKENNDLKYYQVLSSQLTKENCELKVKIKALEDSLNHQLSVKQDSFQQTSENKIDRSSPDGQESVSEEILNQEFGKDMNQQVQKCLEPQQFIEIQNKELVEQNR